MPRQKIEEMPYNVAHVYFGPFDRVTGEPTNTRDPPPPVGCPGEGNYFRPAPADPNYFEYWKDGQLWHVGTQAECIAASQADN